MHLLVYVDDIIVIGSSPPQVHDLIQTLVSRFSLKDLSHLSYFLGVEAFSISYGLFFSQCKYIFDLLQRTKMDEVKPIDNPLSTIDSLRLNNGKPSIEATEYRCVLGAMQYLSFTRLDISFVVNKLF